MATPEQIVAWRKNPLLYVQERFGATPDKWQALVLIAFPHNKRIAMKACKGPGKTTVLAWLSWHFLETRPHSQIFATSITEANLKDGLWKEMAKWRNKSEYLKEHFVWTKTQIFAKDFQSTWFMSARTWDKNADSEQQANSLAGIHADYTMAVCDEVGSYPDSVIAAAEGSLASGIENRIIIAGNPTHLTGPLYKAVTKEKHLWHVVEITADPDDPNRTPRVLVQWAREQIEKYGRDSPWVMVNVFGRFPPQSMNSMFSVSDVDEAMNRIIRPEIYEYSQKRLGVDVARFGDDSTILFPRQGLKAFSYVELKNADSFQVAARIAMARDKWKQELDFVDGTGGYGSGVIDYMRNTGHSPVEVNFSSKAMNPKYYNMRSEMWNIMAAWVKNGGALPKCDLLREELIETTYFHRGDKMLIEPKELIKARLGRSPDRGDALACTFALPEEFSNEVTASTYDNGEASHNGYDPFSVIKSSH